MPWRQLQPVRRVAILLLGLFAPAFTAIIIVAGRGDGNRIWGFLTRIPFGDKFGHVGLLAVFSLLLNLTLGARCASRRFGGWMLGSALLIVVMTLEEFSQVFITTRTFDVVDWLASLAGIAAGGFVARRILGAPRRSSPGTS